MNWPNLSWWEHLRCLNLVGRASDTSGRHMLARCGPRSSRSGGALAAHLNPVVAPTSAKTTRYTNDELLAEALASSEWGAVIEEARAIGMDAASAQRLCQVLITNTRRQDANHEIHFRFVKDLFVSCGLSKSDAVSKIRNALLAVRNLNNIDPIDNNYFRIRASDGKLDAKHLSGVFLKRDGLHEVLHSGADQLSIRIRTFASALVRIVDAQLDRARRFEEAHRDTEAERVQSSQLLKRTIQEAMPCSERSARARVRKFNVQEYNALGLVDKKMPGYKTATEALVSVTSSEAVVPRKGGVANNLTTVGKDAIRYMNSAVTQDVIRRQQDIEAATTEKEKAKLLGKAMSERVMRLQRFSVFHEDPAMVGVENASVDPVAQSHHYLNQPKEKREFE